MGEAGRQTRVCAERSDEASEARRVSQTSRRRGRERLGRLVNIERSGHVWVQVMDGDEPYSLRCMTMAPFTDDDLNSEVLVWEHSMGVGVVIARGLDSHPPDPGHTRESFVRTLDVLPHEVEDVGVKSAREEPDALATTTVAPGEPETLDAVLVAPHALEALRSRAAEGAALEATVDGRRVRIDAAAQLVVSCGDARIVIRAGRDACAQ
ncbi:MAG: hypothetical protein ABW252_01395 [Polyangiales bacterium]